MWNDFSWGNVIGTWRVERCRPASAPPQMDGVMTPARSHRPLSFVSGSEVRSPSHPERANGKETLRFETPSPKPPTNAGVNVSAAMDSQVGCCPAAGPPRSAPGQGRVVFLWVHRASRPAWCRIYQREAVSSQQEQHWGPPPLPLTH